MSYSVLYFLMMWFTGFCCTLSYLNVQQLILKYYIMCSALLSPHLHSPFWSISLALLYPFSHCQLSSNEFPPHFFSPLFAEVICCCLALTKTNKRGSQIVYLTGKRHCKLHLLNLQIYNTILTDIKYKTDIFKELTRLNSFN